MVKDECLFSVEVRTEKEAEKLADHIYNVDTGIEDWTYTSRPMSKTIMT